MPDLVISRYKIQVYCPGKFNSINHFFFAHYPKRCTASVEVTKRMRIPQKNAENLFFSFQRHRFACLPIISISSCLFSFKYCLLCESSSLKCSQDASICDKSSSEMQYSCFEISKIMPNHLATGRGCFFGRVARIKAFAVQRLPQILCLWRR